MKKSFNQGKLHKYIFFAVFIAILIPLLLFALSACQQKLDVESIYINESSIPQDIRVSDLNLSDINLVVVDSKGIESTVALSASMLSTDSRNKIKEGGEHNLTVRYQSKTTTFNIRLFNDDDELVTIVFKDRNNNVLATMVTIKGGSLTPPNFPIIDGYRAEYWVDSANNEVVFTSINESIDVKVKYIKDTICTVTFYDHLGVVVEEIEVEQGNRLPYTPAPTFLPEGTSTWDWYYGNNKLNIETLYINEDIIIKAKIEPIKYTVTYVFYNNSGEKITLGSEQVSHNGNAKNYRLAENELLTYGYEFKNWKTALQNIIMDLEVSANVEIISYTVNFLDFNKNVIATREIEHGGRVQLDSIGQPTAKDGFTFTGKWTDEQHNEIGENILNNITSDFNFYADYKPQSILITLYQDGIKANEIYKDYGTIIDANNLNELATESGKKLLGIYGDAQLQKSYSLPYRITTAVSFHLKWLDTINGNSELSYSPQGDDMIVTAYNGNDSIIYIPSTYNGKKVVKVGENAFKNKPIIEVNFGSNITEIAQGAFEGTGLLGVLQLPPAINIVGERAFANCIGLESIIAESQASFVVGNGAFQDCTALWEFSINKLAVIGNYAFENTSLINIDLSNTIDIGNHAFENNRALTQVAFGASLANVGEYAFASTVIEQLNISASSSIGSFAFANNKQLTTVTIAVDILKSYTFSNCTALAQIALVNGMETVEDFAFHNCSSISVLSLPNTISTISAKALNSIHHLTNIAVSEDNTNYSSSDGILYNKDKTEIIAYPIGKIVDSFTLNEQTKIIGKSAFENTTIATLILPNTLEEVKENAFYSRFIVAIVFTSDAPPSIASSVHLFSDSLRKLYVPDEFKANYTIIPTFDRAESLPIDFESNSKYDESSGLVYIIENSTVTIITADKAKTSVTIPSKINGITVTAIADYAFENCTQLQSITIDAPLLLLGEYTFKGCISLANIVFSAITTESTEFFDTLNLNAFEDTKWYTDSNLIVIGTSAVAYKAVLDKNGVIVKRTQLEIPSGVERLCKDLFNNSAGSALTAVILPTSLKIIQERAFFGSKILTISIPSKVTTIEKNAFENCTQLQSIQFFTTSLNEIKQNTFANCISLEEITLPNNTIVIGQEAFLNNTSLRKITLPNSLIKIGAYAFKGCISMPTIEIPNKVGTGIDINENAIGDGAFQNCNSLVYIRFLSSTPPRIGSEVFSIGGDLIGNNTYIYVQDSDGNIINTYKSQWQEYGEHIRQLSQSPKITFIIGIDSQGEEIEALRGVSKAPMRESILYYAPTLEEQPNGYLFVGWEYKLFDAWTAVTYPFLISDNIVLKAKWVKKDEGSLLINDLQLCSDNSAYEIISYGGTDTKVVIPANYKNKPVVSIANNTFQNIDYIIEFIFLDSSNILAIGERAFADLSNVTSIVLPSSLQIISDYAFENCENLRYIFIPKSVKSIGKFAFKGCSNLHIEFEEGSELRYADSNCFEDTLWYAEQKVYASSNFVIAGQLAIEYRIGENQSLVAIPIEVTALKDRLFMNNNNILTLQLHTNMEFIGEECFYNCTNLISIEFGSFGMSQINYVGDNAFSNTAWQNNQDFFVQVGGVLIEYKGSSTEIVLPDTITAIGKGAFAYKAITSIALPNTLKNIADSAFYNCYNLESIVIPSQVKFIGREAFARCTSLQDITFEGSSLEEIAENAFYGCSSLGMNKKIILPSSVNILGSGAFEDCNSLREVDLSKTTLTSLSDNLFANATSLNSIALPKTLIAILGYDETSVYGDTRAFKGCANLENITIDTDNNLVRIDQNALQNTVWYNKKSNTEDTFITLGNVFLKFRASTNGIKNKEIVLPNNIKYIATEAFMQSDIKSIDLGESLLEIGVSAFAGCRELLELVVPNSTITIKAGAFFGCEKLNTVSLGTSLESIGANAFQNCYELYKVVINKMGIGELSNDKHTEMINALESGNINDWILNNPTVFIGTQLLGEHIFSNASQSLRLYVVRASSDINIALYRYKWQTLNSRIFNVGDWPTASFVDIAGAKPIDPISIEILQDSDIDTTYKGFTLLGWEIVQSPESEDGERISLPYKMKRNILIRPIWIKNDRESIADSQLGYNYAPNAHQTAYTIRAFSDSVYNDINSTLVIPSKVLGLGLIGINDGVFTENNTVNIKTVLITDNDNLELFNKNIFNVFTNLEKIIVDGNDFATLEDYQGYNGIINSRYVSIDGVLYTKDLKTLVAFPRAKKQLIENGDVVPFDIPYGVENILSSAFESSSLESLNFSSSVLFIGEDAFKNNCVQDEHTNELSGLRNIKFPVDSRIEEIAYNALSQTAWYNSFLSDEEIFIKAGSYLIDYRGYATTVVIPDSIKTIGTKAFLNNGLNYITTLIVPSSVERINKNAFSGCSNIIDIIFEADSNLMYVDSNVFNDTSWITAMDVEVNEFVKAGNVLIKFQSGRQNIELPEDIKVIGHNAFNNTSLQSIVLHNGLERIEEGAFYGANNLESIIIPDSVVFIGKDAFHSCNSLSQVIFGEGSNLKEIDNSAFAYCQALEEIIIPRSLKKIGNNAFDYCTSLITVTIGEDSELEELGSNAFKNAQSLYAIHIPNGIKEIKASTFENCSALVNLTFSSDNRKLTKIGENAFKGCSLLGSDLTNKTSLLTVKLPYNVNTIESGAFSGCSNLYGINLQGQIRRIGAYAFNGCTSLSNITIGTATPPVIDVQSFNYNDHPNVRIYVNSSNNNSILNDYIGQWGQEIVAKSENIFVRNNNNLPLIQFYDYIGGGQEQHLAQYDMNAELLSMGNLPTTIRHSTKGMAIGFYTDSNFRNQICTLSQPFEVVRQNTLKIYIAWENS